MTYCLFGSILICIKYVLWCGTSDIEYDAHIYVEKPAAKLIIRAVVGNAEVVGWEHLPPAAPPTPTPAPVYIANHASQIDTAVVYFFNRRFKWIAKKSVLFLPGVGQLMALAGHVLIDRKKGKNSNSVSNLFDKSNQAVQSGIPMFFFPQGTRRIAGPQLPFKDGAFIVAETNHCCLVPLSIYIPKDAWNHWYPLSLLWTNECPIIKITIHKPILCDTKSSSNNRENIKSQCEKAIYSALPTNMYRPRNDGGTTGSTTSSDGNKKENHNDKDR